MSKARFALLMLCATSCGYAQEFNTTQTALGESDYPIKYAIYSTAWGTNSNAGLRLVTQNQSEHTVSLRSVLFSDEQNPQNQRRLTLNLDIPSGKWAEMEMPYVDLLFGNECITRTMQEDWKLVEISNYTLNPSVRGLIIEDTDSFRIYQCVRNVQVKWVDSETGEENDYTEWVMYHFERRRPN